MTILLYDKIEDVNKFNMIKKFADTIVRRKDGKFIIEKNRQMYDKNEIIDVINGGEINNELFLRYNRIKKNDYW